MKTRILFVIILAGLLSHAARLPAESRHLDSISNLGRFTDSFGKTRKNCSAEDLEGLKEPIPSSGTGWTDSGRKERTFTDSRGVTSKFRIFIPPISEPKKVIIFFHGDQSSRPESQFDYNTMFPELKSYGKNKNAVVLFVRAPGGRPSNWWTNQRRNRKYFNELMTEVETHVNIDKAQVFVTGGSGGPTFFLGDMLKDFCKRYGRFGGGAALFCPSRDMPEEPFAGNSACARNFPIYMRTSPADQLYGRAVAAAKDLTNKKFKITLDVEGGAGHCLYKSANGDPFRRILSMTKQKLDELICPQNRKFSRNNEFANVTRLLDAPKASE